MSTFSVILCVVNLTENIDDIIFYARDLAVTNKAQVVLFNSLPRVDNLYELALIQGGEDALRNSILTKANNFLDKIIQENFEGIEVKKELSEKNVAHNITDLVEEYCADIVIMGSMETKGLSSFFVSNRSKDVIGKTRVPVLVVPNDLTLECTPEFE